MRLGLIQVALGVALLGLAWTGGGWAWILAWPAWSGLAVGVAYLGLGGPRIFGKHASDGRLAWLNVIVLMPYYAVAWTLWQLKSRALRENPHDEVAPGIFVGRRPLGAAEIPAAARVVIDMTSEFPRARSTRAVERYLCVPTLDMCAPDDASFASLLDRVSEEEGPIFVYCAMGHGRSATVAAGLMIRRGVARDVEEAIERMTEARPSIYLHAAQRDAVRRAG